MNITLSPQARVRLLECLRQTNPKRLMSGISSNQELISGRSADLFAGATQIVRSQWGVDLEREYGRGIEALCEAASDEHLEFFLLGCAAHLRSWLNHIPIPVTPQGFEMQVNRIFEDNQYPFRLKDLAIVSAIESDAEALRRVLLNDPADVAACKQGDLQTEMVVSTVQERLSQPGAVLVDYGVGLGRILHGLSSAKHFNQAAYVAVDEPISDDVQKLAESIGANMICKQRSQFLKEDFPADVVMVVNTLHHIPFRELATQLGHILSILKPGGALLIHEMGELREPEQRNLPWKVEDIQLLFSSPLLNINVRTTLSRAKKVPLTNALVQVVEKGELEVALKSNACKVWTQMKQRTLGDLKLLYESKDEERHLDLQYKLIANANLDLNQP